MQDIVTGEAGREQDPNLSTAYWGTRYVIEKYICLN